MKHLVAVAVMIVVSIGVGASQRPDESEFARALSAYMADHRAAEDGLPATQASPLTLQSVETTMAARLRARRPGARPGYILGPVAERIRAVVREEIGGPQGTSMLASIEESNIHGVRARINRRYPPGLPRATMPSPMLAKLPPIPAELEYRFLGRSLLLVDARASLVIDVLQEVLPAQVATRRSPQ